MCKPERLFADVRLNLNEATSCRALEVLQALLKFPDFRFNKLLNSNALGILKLIISNEVSVILLMSAIWADAFLSR
jgi:hypothetical protein